MKSISTSVSRRRFIKVSVVGVAATQFGVFVQGASAAELPHLDLADPTAKALGYVHDASTVSNELRGVTSRVCSNCRFFTEDAKEWGPCSLFPGKSVAAQGWCKSWIAKA